MTRSQRRRMLQAFVLLAVLASGGAAGVVAASLPSAETSLRRPAAPSSAGTAPAAPPAAIRMVVGGGYTDTTGRVWEPEYGALGGRLSGTVATVIDGTPDPRLYQRVRWGMRGYDIPVAAPGRYEVTIHVAEIFFDSAGKRVFDVTAEGRHQITGLDVFGAAGGKNRALRIPFEVPVTDGVLNLRFAASENEPDLGALEVRYLSAS